jgi:hypothetical protein
MHDAHAEPDRFPETCEAADADSAAPLEPVSPADGSDVEDVPGGRLAFAWRRDARALESGPSVRALRIDLCVRSAGETRGCVVMLALPGDAFSATIPFDEIRLKLGPRYARPARVSLVWFLSLSRATGGPLYVSRESELVLVVKDTRP